MDTLKVGLRKARTEVYGIAGDFGVVVDVAGVVVVVATGVVAIVAAGVGAVVAAVGVTFLSIAVLVDLAMTKICRVFVVCLLSDKGAAAWGRRVSGEEGETKELTIVRAPRKEES